MSTGGGNFYNLHAQIKKERSNFLFLRLRVYSKRLPLGKIHLNPKWRECRKTPSFRLNIPLLVGSSFRRERREVQTPPLCEFRLAGGVWLVGLTSVFAPGKFWRKGLLRFWLTADLYRGFTSLDSGIFSQNFNTVTNFVKLKLQVQFDICCRTGLILRSLTEAKRNWMFAPRQRNF